MGCFDVIIPCYRYGHFLRRCVESVLNQAGVEVRVLIIDDASPDQTATVAAQLAAQDWRVQFVRHDTNRGHLTTYNEGLDRASGDYTLLLSADDLLTRGALSRAGRLLNAYPGVGLVYGRQITFGTDAELTEEYVAPDECGWRVVPGNEFLETVCASGSNPVATPTAVVRTWLLKEVGGYRAELPHTADMELWMRLANRAAVGILDTDQAFKRMHPHNMQRQYVLESVKDLQQRKVAFDLFFRYCGRHQPGRHRLENLAHQSLAEEAFWAASRAFDAGNLAGCQTLTRFALALSPDLRSRAEWSRFCWKRRLGPRLWSAVRPLVDWLRGR